MTAAALPARRTTQPRIFGRDIRLVESEVLGPQTIPASSILEFSRGLLGFPNYTRYALIAVEQRAGLYWLQSVDCASLTFVLIDPFVAVDGYEVDLPEWTAVSLRASSPDEIMLLAIVTLPGDPHAPFTANLQGPLAINLSSRRAEQLVLPDVAWDTRVPVELSRCR